MNGKSDVYAVITGGSRGIGRATAIRFAREGWNIIITYRSREDCAQKVVEEAKRLGASLALAYKVDVSCPEDVERFKIEVEKVIPYVNVLVNNAGIISSGSIDEISLDEWRKVIDVNLTGVFLVTKTLLPLLLKAPWASIVNVASIAGQTGNVLASVAYASSKAGVIGFTKRLAVELAPKGIRVNAVAPSFVETDLVREFIDTPEKRKKIEELHPLRTILKPEDVAEAILFLADPSKSRTITGHILSLNAGRYT
jgi:3-oxoacyl-[acyl-carrier protein] reductase